MGVQWKLLTKNNDSYIPSEGTIKQSVVRLQPTSPVKDAMVPYLQIC